MEDILNGEVIAKAEYMLGFVGAGFLAAGTIFGAVLLVWKTFFVPMRAGGDL